MIQVEQTYLAVKLPEVVASAVKDHWRQGGPVLPICPFQSSPMERLSGVRRAAGQAGHERSGVLGQRRGEDGTFSHLGTWIKDQQRSPYYLYFLRSQTFAW